jgi:hypothetical protein
MADVTTTLGNVPEHDLAVVEVKEDHGETWVITRVCRYIGLAFPEAYDTVVRQDAWVTFKNGHGAAAATGL